MKKLLLSFLALGLTVGVASAQVRYLDEIYTSNQYDSNVQFGINWDFLLGATPNTVLRTDVYSPPTSDAETGRACVIVLHTGNFLPKYFNKSPGGNNKDSSIVVTSQMFAKRGYVAFAPNYRLGWDAANVDPTFGAYIRRGTLINAVYRAINDVKSLVRYIRKTVAEDGNPYGVDPDKIIIYGHGSGGYISLAYGSLDRFEEIEGELTGKWLSTTNTPAPSNFVLNQPYITPALVGGVDGFGGAVNDTNYFGYSSDVMACVNVGGALGDSSWLEMNEPPIISFHCPNDGFAPFTNGLVIVPTTQEVVVDVVGSRWAIAKANENGNNDAFAANAPFNDPYTTAAETALSSSRFASINNGPSVEVLDLNPADYKGLFPFLRPTIAWPFQEAAPWDWWDETAVVAAAVSLNIPLADAQAIHDNGVSGSPTMSAAQGRAYLDSIHGYLAPRLRSMIAGDVGIEENDFLGENTFVYVNRAGNSLVVRTQEGIRIKNVDIYNLSGALVRSESSLNKLSLQINGIDNLTTGLYLVSVITDYGVTSKKVYVQ